MDTTIDKIENSEALIKIRLKEDDYQPRVSQKIKDFSKKANIKGFRPGKVPPGLIKSMYGTSFIAEEVNKMISEELNKTLRDSELQFLGEPLSHESQPTIDWETQKDFEFVFVIGYADPFEIVLDKKVKVDYNKIKVDEAVINETIENLQKQFGEQTTLEAMGKGDIAYGTVTSSDESINKEVSIDTSKMKDAVSKKMIGLKIGDKIELDLSKAYDDLHDFTHGNRITEAELKAVKNKVTFSVSGITHTEPAKINQEFFDRTFGKDAVASETEFRTKVEETINKNYEAEAKRFFHFKLRETFNEKTSINLPDAFLKRWLRETNENITESILEEEYEQYAKELKWSLIRNKISKDQDLKATYEEVREEAKTMIVQQFGGPAIIEQLGSQLDAMADNYLQSENGDNYMKMHNEILNQKVYAYIEEQITAKEKMVSLDEFRKL